MTFEHFPNFTLFEKMTCSSHFFVSKAIMTPDTEKQTHKASASCICFNKYRGHCIRPMTCKWRKGKGEQRCRKRKCITLKFSKSIAIVFKHSVVSARKHTQTHTNTNASGFFVCLTFCTKTECSVWMHKAASCRQREEQSKPHHPNTER